jgi:riboflavin synthase
MFTGLVDHCGHIEEIIPAAASMRLKIRTQFENLVLGESISVEGICLTVTHIEKGNFYCDISPETLACTTAKNFQVGQLINLERALTLSTPLGGHFVVGHVDTEIQVKEVLPQDAFWVIAFEGLTKTMLKYIVEKGSITINGVSLTINEVFSEGFSVMLIPHTLEKTSLKTLKAQDAVNVEWDYFARYIVNYLEKFKEKTT